MDAPAVPEILLVEDNPEDVELTRRALARARVVNRLALARDGAEALDLLLGRDASFSVEALKVVLLDLKLPRVDGFEVLERMKADDRLRLLPVVVLTSSAEGPDVQRAYALGANSYIVKPVEFDKFLEAVGQVGLYWLLVNRVP